MCEKCALHASDTGIVLAPGLSKIMRAVDEIQKTINLVTIEDLANAKIALEMKEKTSTVKNFMTTVLNNDSVLKALIGEELPCFLPDADIEYFGSLINIISQAKPAFETAHKIQTLNRKLTPETNHEPQ